MPVSSVVARALLASSIVAAVCALSAQERAAQKSSGPSLQPLAQQARRLETAFNYLGEPLSDTEHKALDEAIGTSDEAAAIAGIQQVLDPHVLVAVHISPESRVRLEQGAAPPELVQGGTRLFLVKVLNDAGVTAPLAIQSPNVGNVYIRGGGSPEPKKVLTDVDVRERWADMSFYTQPPMRQRLICWRSGPTACF